MKRQMTKEEALKAFTELLESEELEEVLVHKVYIDESNTFRSQIVIRVVLKE